MELGITRTIRLQNGRVILDGIVEYSADANSAAAVLRSVYRHYGISYPKFFKMDNLCRLCFLSAEILLQGTDILRNYPGEEIGIILSNASSSLDSDEKHQESIRDANHYFPSPSVFVYTLPNIMVGEIAIRHKIKGENAVLIFEQFDPFFIFQYVSELFRNQRVHCCLAGWIECYGNSYRSLLFVVEQIDRIKRLNKFQEWFIFDPSNLEKCFVEGKSL
ncbi:MAG: 3-oxoacyl-ACP synthase [Deltaproteobacteria bacterium]|nr:3-oxoacyl-ACP synthase [Deltaproteobacteria bacterium]